MFVYLMRHAEAKKAGGESATDADRPLTDFGRLQAKAIGRELKRRGIPSPKVLCSPYRRTLQTAEILSSALEVQPPQPENELASSGHAPDLSLILERHPKAASLLLIGHQPDIGMLVEKLIGFEFGFSTATVIAFEKTGPWRYLWTVKPEDVFEK